jgi:DNA-binding CsgD family transcriptional regulator
MGRTPTPRQIERQRLRAERDAERARKREARAARENEMLRLRESGVPTKDIAAQFGLHTSTVRSYLEAIRRRARIAAEGTARAAAEAARIAEIETERARYYGATGDPEYDIPRRRALDAENKASAIADAERRRQYELRKGSF